MQGDNAQIRKTMAELWENYEQVRVRFTTEKVFEEETPCGEVWKELEACEDIESKEKAWAACQVVQQRETHGAIKGTCMKAFLTVLEECTETLEELLK